MDINENLIQELTDRCSAQAFLLGLISGGLFMLTMDENFTSEQKELIKKLFNHLTLKMDDYFYHNCKENNE